MIDSGVSTGPARAFFCWNSERGLTLCPLLQGTGEIALKAELGRQAGSLRGKPLMNSTHSDPPQAPLSPCLLFPPELKVPS